MESSYRARGRGTAPSYRRRGTPFKSTKIGNTDSGVDSKEILDGLPPAVLTLSPPLKFDGNDPSIRGFRDVASYNWIDEKRPTIVVPGVPDYWSPPEVPFTVEKDSEDRIVSVSHDRLPDHPMDPLIVAVKEMNPSFDFTTIDFVSDRNGLRKLIRWLDGSGNQNWRIDMEKVGDTLFMQRWEPKARVTQGHAVVYAQNFAKIALDPPDLGSPARRSVGFHRVVTYQFGKAGFLMGLTSHAFDPTITEENEDFNAAGASSQTRAERDGDLDELQALLGGLAVSARTRPNPNVRVIKFGEPRPSSGFVEFKTRSENTLKYRGLDWGDMYPELLFSQAAGVHIAVHHAGQFSRVDTYTMKDKELLDAGDKARKSLKQLTGVLKMLQEIADGSYPGLGGIGKTRFALSCCDGIVKVHSGSALNSFVDPNLLD